MIDLKQMRKDMEAGTHKETALTYNDVEWCAYRIEQLEREYTALREAADALAKSLNDMIVDPDFFRPYARATLTRYEAPTREATK